jgi:hypothetical protein
VKVGTCICGAVGLLEADEGAGGGLSVVGGQDLDALDLAEAREMGLQVVDRELGREVLHEEVALLLGVLESLLLTLDHHLSLDGSQSWLHVELVALDFLVIEFSDGLLG